MTTAIAEGKYLYCIVRDTGQRELTSRGVGEGGEPVYTIAAGGLAAVVSDSPLVEYESNRRNMLAHTRVLEEAMGAGSILPVRFGTIAPNSDAILRQLEGQRAVAIAAQLDRLSGRVELGLRAFWYEEAIFAEIVAASPEIRQLRDALAGRPAHERYYDRIRLGELVEAGMAARRAADSERILAAVSPLAEQQRLSPPITDRMVVNAAFLLPTEHEAAFEAAVRALDAELGQRLLFKLVGPVPPYNFVSLSLGWD